MMGKMVIQCHIKLIFILFFFLTLVHARTYLLRNCPITKLSKQVIQFAEPISNIESDPTKRKLG